MSDATNTIERSEDCAPQTAEQLLPLAYQELRQLAAHKLAGCSSDQTLQPTALLHEAYLRLAGPPIPAGWGLVPHG